MVDYPPEESEAFARALQDHGMDPIFLLAPTSTEERIDRIVALASGYLYYVSLKGITGAGNLDADNVNARIAALKRRTRMPIGVGFGIKDAASARAVARVADAVVIGSRIIQELENAPRERAVAAVELWLAQIRVALDEDRVRSAA